MRFLKYIFLYISCAFMVGTATAQNTVTVRGVVRDAANKEAKAGVNITALSPTKHLALTDENGAFAFSVAPGTEVEFSYTGYATIKRVIKTATENLEILLTVGTGSAMSEVVVMGFTKKSRELATGSSTVISGKSIQDVPVSNAMSLLQGRVAGLNIQNNDGSPGGMGTINLRGLSSISISGDGMLTPTSPLFIIDGVPVDVNSNYQYGFQSAGSGINPLSLIPVEDIESFEVLKDAAATSQYGSRAAYGVIIVTTKRGMSKIPVVQYSSSVFVNTTPRLRPIIGGKEERLIRINTILNYDTASAEVSKALINRLPFLSDSLNPFYNNATNWQDYYYKTTINHQHNLNIYGGDRTFNYKTNLNYQRNNGVVQNTGFNRYALSMFAGYQPVEAFRMTVNLSGALGQKRNGSGVGLVQTGVADGASASSLLPPPSLFAANNNVLQAANVKDNNKSINLSASLDIMYEFIKGIRLQNILSYNFNSNTSDNFKPSYLNNGSSKAWNYNDRNYTVYNRSSLNFNKVVNEHIFNGYVYNEITSYGTRASAILLGQTPNDQITGPIGSNYLQTKGGTIGILDTRTHAYGANAMYAFNTKYILTLDYRFDGTSTNGPSQGYTQSPGISFRWNFNREKWFDNASWLSYGSLRGSWGKVLRPTGSIFDVYGKYVIGPRFNNQQSVLIDFTTIPNVNFVPEVQTQYSTGLELGLFKNRWEMTYDAYFKTNDNQILSLNLNNTNGFTRVQANAASIANYGFEMSQTIRVFDPQKPLNWTLMLNGAFNRDKLVQLPTGVREIIKTDFKDGDFTIPVVYRLGRNSLSNLMYNTTGVYASDADVPVNPATGNRLQLGVGTGNYFKAGDPIWTDVNGDYIIDDKDLLPIGNPVPLVVGGFTSELRWKNKITLTINASYTLKRDLLNIALANQLKAYSNPTSADEKLHSLTPIDNYNYWQPSNAGRTEGTVNATYPNPFDFRRAGTMQPFRDNQTLFMEDGSYFKLGTIVLAYNVDRNRIERYGMTSLRLSLSANNVYIFSKYRGPDPELVTALGRDYSNGYPNARTYSFNIAIQF